MYVDITGHRNLHKEGGNEMGLGWKVNKDSKML